MLKPYICVTCEKVIIEKLISTPGEPSLPDESGAGPASLISLFSKLLVAAAAAGEAASIPTNAIIPKEWAIYTEWDVEPGDENRSYVLNAHVLFPDGTPFGEPAKIQINVTPNRRSQVIVRCPAFPIGQVGMYTARVWIEENQQRVGEHIDLKVEVAHLHGHNRAP
jgi:hypothetical protein